MEVMGDKKEGKALSRDQFRPSCGDQCFNNLEIFLVAFSVWTILILFFSFFVDHLGIDFFFDYLSSCFQLDKNLYSCQVPEIYISIGKPWM